MKLKNLNIKTIINISMSIVFILFMLFGMMSVWSSNYLWETTTSVYNHPYTTLRLLHEFELAKNAIYSEVNILVLEEDEGLIPEYINRINENEAIALEKIAGFKISYLGPKSDTLKIETDFKQYMIQTKETIQLYLNGDISSVTNRLGSDGLDYLQFSKINASIHTVDFFAKTKATQFYMDAQYQKDSILYGLIAFLVLIFILFLVINRLLRTGILDPIQRLIVEATGISEGKLETRDANTLNNELSQFSKSFNVMAEALQNNSKKDNKRENELIIILKNTLALNEKISQTEKYNRNLIESSLDSFVTIGPDGTITDVNSATEKATGLMRDKLIGTRFSDYFTDPEVAYLGYQKAFKDMVLFDYKLDLKHVDGHVTPVLYNASVYKDVDDRVIGVFATARDISTIVKTQNELIEMKNNLLSAVKGLEALSYSVSHDLKAPVRHINAYVSLLKQKYANLLPEEGNHYLNNIQDSSTNMGELIDGLLQFSRTGQVEMHKRLLNMNAILKEIIIPIKDSNIEHRIEWEIDELPSVYGDYNLIKSVWVNLVENAVKFSKNKEVAKIHIGAIESDKEITYFVADNGVGFDMKYSSKLFSVFQRLHSHEEFEGTGVGLASIRNIMNRHNGKTWAEGEINEGACIYFSLNKRGN